MLQPTERALDVLRAILNAKRPRADCIRLTTGKGGPRLMTDRLRLDDATIVEDDGTPLLVAEQSVADRLDGHTLDFNKASSQLTVS